VLRRQLAQFGQDRDRWGGCTWGADPLAQCSLAADGRAAARSRDSHVQLTMRDKIIPGLLIWTLLLVVAAVSDARSSFSTRLTIVATARTPGYSLSGAVTSRHRSCVKDRTLKVYVRRSHQHPSLLGYARSSATGKWRLAHSAVPLGEYYATVVNRTVARGTCKGTQSPTVTLAPPPVMQPPVPPVQPPVQAQPPVPPSGPLTCDPGYVPGHIPGVGPEFCIPAHGPVVDASCAVGAHAREHYFDQCVPDDPPSARQ
jgi:hypothetical protein